MLGARLRALIFRRREKQAREPLSPKRFLKLKAQVNPGYKIAPARNLLLIFLRKVDGVPDYVSQDR
jgi:hypothetical protein